ncbi:unnamed protein product, partial [marine sediment metagenome]
FEVVWLCRKHHILADRGKIDVTEMIDMDTTEWSKDQEKIFSGSI